MSALRIRELPGDERPREKLASRGPESLSDSELLAIFLRVGVEGESAVDLGRNLLRTHGGLRELAQASIAELSKPRGMGLAKACQLAAAFELGRRFAAERVKDLPLDNPEAIYDLLHAQMRPLRQESIRVLSLDTRYRMIAHDVVGLGTVNECIAHPREILRCPLVHAAHAFILAHNHPSGDPSPSRADRDLTRRIHRASEELGIQFADHVIVGAPGNHGDPYFSFREFGLL